MSRFSPSVLTAQWIRAILLVLAMLGTTSHAQTSRGGASTQNQLSRQATTATGATLASKPKPGTTTDNPSSGGIFDGGEVSSGNDDDSSADEDSNVEQTETVRILGNQWVVPFHDSNWRSGDREFDGNGPKISIRALVYISGKTRIRTRLSMTAHETKADSTFGTGHSEPWTVYTVPDGFEIVEILGVDDSRPIVEYTDDDHSVDTFNTPFGVVTSYGDGSGKDLLDDNNSLANYCRAKLNWDLTFSIRIKPIDTSYQVRTVSLRDQYVLRLQNNGQGDNEFGGNGPQMEFWGNVRYAYYHVTFNLNAFAREQGGDGSQGYNFRSDRLYSPPSGYEIVDLLDHHGKPLGNHGFGGDFVLYTDRDHGANFFETQIGTARMFGDRSGHDLTGYTQAELHGVNYKMLVVLEPTN